MINVASLRFIDGLVVLSRDEQRQVGELVFELGGRLERGAKKRAVRYRAIAGAITRGEAVVG